MRGIDAEIEQLRRMKKDLAAERREVTDVYDLVRFEVRNAQWNLPIVLTSCIAAFTVATWKYIVAVGSLYQNNDFMEADWLPESLSLSASIPYQLLAEYGHIYAAEAWPLLTMASTSGIAYIVGDVVAQRVEGRWRVGLLDLASHRSYAARQLKRWSGQWEASRTRDLPALDAMTDLLRRVLPEREELRLVHGDFHIRNVITDPGSGRIRGVLDWELATLGDPMADIGSLLAYWPQAEDPGPFAPSMLPGFADRATLAAAYLEASGRDPATLDFWHALGLWKIAVIAEGVLRRTTDDPRNTAEGGAPRPEFVEHLVDRAWNVASAAGLDRRQSSTT